MLGTVYRGAWHARRLRWSGRKVRPCIPTHLANLKAKGVICFWSVFLKESSELKVLTHL